MDEKNYKKLLTILILFFLLILAVFFLYIINLRDSVNNYKTNYEFACREGTEKVCITEGSNYEEYSDSEYLVAIQRGHETYKICNKDRGEYAVCISEGRSWTQCEEGYDVRCVPRN